MLIPPPNFSNGNSGTYDDRYLIGPTAEIHFPFNLSFELDALYRRNGATAIGAVTGNSRVNDWQFAFLAKYELKRGLVRPFVDARLVYRHFSGGALYSIIALPNPATLLNPITSFNSTTLFNGSPNLTGFAAGGGVTLKVLNFRLSPEVRYTHWFNASGTALAVASLNSDQADLLVGFTF